MILMSSCIILGCMCPLLMSHMFLYSIELTFPIVGNFGAYFAPARLLTIPRFHDAFVVPYHMSYHKIAAHSIATLFLSTLLFVILEFLPSLQARGIFRFCNVWYDVTSSLILLLQISWPFPAPYPVRLYSIQRHLHRLTAFIPPNFSVFITLPVYFPQPWPPVVLCVIVVVPFVICPSLLPQDQRIPEFFSSLLSFLNRKLLVFLLTMPPFLFLRMQQNQIRLILEPLRGRLLPWLVLISPPITDLTSFNYLLLLVYVYVFPSVSFVRRSALDVPLLLKLCLSDLRVLQDLTRREYCEWSYCRRCSFCLFAIFYRGSCIYSCDPIKWACGCICHSSCSRARSHSWSSSWRTGNGLCKSFTQNHGGSSSSSCTFVGACDLCGAIGYLCSYGIIIFSSLFDFGDPLFCLTGLGVNGCPFIIGFLDFADSSPSYWWLAAPTSFGPQLRSGPLNGRNDWENLTKLVPCSLLPLLWPLAIVVMWT